MKTTSGRGSKYVALRLERLREERRRIARQRATAIGYVGPGDDRAAAAAEIRAHCERNDLVLVGIVVEMLGADSIVPHLRPGFAMVLASCRAGRCGAVVVFRAASLGSAAVQEHAAVALGPEIGLAAASGRPVDGPGLVRRLARAAARVRPARRPRFGMSKKPEAARVLA